MIYRFTPKGSFAFINCQEVLEALLGHLACFFGFVLYLFFFLDESSFGSGLGRSVKGLSSIALLCVELCLPKFIC